MNRLIKKGEKMSVWWNQAADTLTWEFSDGESRPVARKQLL